MSDGEKSSGLARRRVGWLAAGGAAVIFAAAAYWLFRPVEPAGAANAEDPVLAAMGQAIYAVHCAACHGAALEGQLNWKIPNADGTLLAPPHDASGHTWHHPDSVLFRITRLGGQTVAPAGFVSGMPAFGDKLGAREIWAALAFIKSTWPADIRARQEAINRRVAGGG